MGHLVGRTQKRDKRDTRCGGSLRCACSAWLQVRTHGTHQIEGRIVGVTDGDTITLLDVDNRQHKIRLDGIDAPESGQPFGRASKQHLAELLANREAVAECSKIDRYRREVCRVLVGGADAGLEQVRADLAWFFSRYAKELPPEISARAHAGAGLCELGPITRADANSLVAVDECHAEPLVRGGRHAASGQYIQSRLRRNQHLEYRAASVGMKTELRLVLLHDREFADIAVTERPDALPPLFPGDVSLLRVQVPGFD